MARKKPEAPAAEQPQAPAEIVEQPAPEAPEVEQSPAPEAPAEQVEPEAPEQPAEQEQPAAEPAPVPERHVGPELFALKLTAAIAISGEIHKAGSIVHLREREAKDLLQRGKAEIATR